MDGKTYSICPALPFWADRSLYCITTFIQNSNTFSITSQVSCNSHAAKVWSHKNLPQFFSSHTVPSSDTNWLFLFLLKGFWLIHWSGLNQGSSKDPGHSRSRASNHKVQSCSCSLCKASTQLQSNLATQQLLKYSQLAEKGTSQCRKALSGQPACSCLNFFRATCKGKELLLFFPDLRKNIFYWVQMGQEEMCLNSSPQCASVWRMQNLLWTQWTSY